MTHDATIVAIAAACYIGYRMVEAWIHVHRARRRVGQR